MIIVTGGAGFIGSCFVKKLNDMGREDILIVDNLGNSQKWKNLVGKKFYDIIHKDEFPLKVLNYKLPAEYDCVFHFGACSDTTQENVNYLIDNNYNFTKNLAVYCLEKGIRFVYASSAATYGMGENGYSDDDVFGLKPLNAYGFSKQLFDEWVFTNNYAHDVLGLKFFNVFGPNEYHKGNMSSMVLKAYNQIKDNGKVKLFKSNHPEYADGKQVRDFVYVKDVVEAVYSLYSNSRIYGLFNIGTGKSRSWSDLVSAVNKAMGKRAKIEYVDMPENIKTQYQNFTEADMSRFERIFPDFQFTSLEDAADDYVKNYLMKDWMYL